MYFYVFKSVSVRESEMEEGKGCCGAKLSLNSYTGKQLLHITNPWNNVKIVCLDRFGQEWRSVNL